MSGTQFVRNDSEGRSKRGLRREPGACEPCKYFKTKCNHQMPCGACRDDTQRYGPCAYSKRAVSMQNFDLGIEQHQSVQHFKLQTGATENDCTVDSFTQHDSSAVEHIDSSKDQSASQIQSQPGDNFFLGLLSIPLVIDKFKFLKSAPTFAQNAISKFDGSESSDDPQSLTDIAHLSEDVTGESTSASKLKKASNTAKVEQLKEEFEGIVDLVWKGKLAQAWFGLGLFSRKAYAAYRHTQTATYDETGSTKDLQTLWSRFLSLEIHLSLLLGEPALSIPQEPQTVNVTTANLWQEDQWIEPMRQILHRHVQILLALDSTQVAATERFVNAAGNIISHTALIQAAYCITEEHSIDARELQMTIHLIFLLLRCCFAEIAQHDLTLNLDALSPETRDQIFHKRRSKLLHCRLALKSAKFIVNIFRQIFDTSSHRATMWIQCHAVWIASTVLAIGKVRSEIDWSDATEKLQHVEDIFKNLADRHPDGCLFAPAAGKLHDLSAIAQIKGTHAKKRGAATLDDESWESAGKRQRRSSVDQMSTPGRTGAKSESEDFSSSSDLVPATNRSRLHDQSVPLSFGEDQSRSIPITPTSVLSYNHTPYHVGGDQDNQQLEQWSNTARKQYSPQFQVHYGQASGSYAASAMACDQTVMSGLSSPIQLFQPGFVPVDAAGYERMLHEGGANDDGSSVNVRSSWDGRHLNVNDHSMRRWQDSRYIGVEEHRSMRLDGTRADTMTTQHFPLEVAHPNDYTQRSFGGNQSGLDLSNAPTQK